MVVYLAKDSESREVAEYYAEKRKIPRENIIGLNVKKDTGISRDDYTLNVQLPLLRELQDRRLMKFDVEVEPRRRLRRTPTPSSYLCTESKVRYMVLSFGFPYQLKPDTNLVEEIPQEAPPQVRRNEAAVDSELALLPQVGHYPFWGPTPNPGFAATNSAQLHPTQGLFLVTRLDGPDKEIAKGLVDKALEAEANGLMGNAYFDLRGIKDGPYRPGEDWFTNMATISRRLGFSTYVDNNPETLPSTFPLSHVAIYGGWYSANADGPFYLADVEFMPGAIGYHLHSFSASSLRSRTHGWTGPLLTHGVTASMGSVYEPYLSFTPNPGLMLALMAQFQFTLGEAGTACQPFLSWMNVVVGDPLYRPFAKGLLEMEQDLTAKQSPDLAWALLRKVNYHLADGRDPEILRQYLIETSITRQSSVLSEKVAMMFAEKSNHRQAIEWNERALKLPTSLQQRTRILLNLADWKERLADIQGAAEHLRQVEEEHRAYKDFLAFREKQHRLASLIGDQSELDRLRREIDRLKPSDES